MKKLLKHSASLSKEVRELWNWNILTQILFCYIQVGFMSLERETVHILPGQPLSVLCHPQCKEVLPHGEVEFPVI